MLKAVQHVKAFQQPYKTARIGLSMSVYGYVRVSTNEQVKGQSLDEQQRRINGVAMINGQEVARMFCDPGVSGSVHLGSRAAGQELLEALQKGDTVIVSKLDRAFRSAADALTTAETWKKKGFSLIVADMGPEPITGNGAAKMFFGMLALVAEFERDRITERITEGKKAKRLKGGYLGGARPYGYAIQGQGKDAIILPIPSEQDIINLILNKRDAGTSLRKISEAIEKETGERLSHMTVGRIIKDSDDR
jgi:putative DNA-invertase from lambdoid prophage Rac